MRDGILIASIILFFLFFSCSENKNACSVTDFIGVTFDLKCSKKVPFNKNSNKIIVYFDSTHCNSCALDDVIIWEKHIEELESYNLEIMLLCAKNREKLLLDYMAEYSIKYPLLVAFTENPSQSYPFLQQEQFRTFVLNPENEIIWIGSPIYNKNTWKQFCEMMTLLVGK